MSETIEQIASGYNWEGRPFVPGVNCVTCGRFVDREGSIEVACFEMSNTVAYVEGECSRCLARAVPSRTGGVDQ